MPSRRQLYIALAVTATGYLVTTALLRRRA